MKTRVACSLLLVAGWPLVGCSAPPGKSHHEPGAFTAAGGAGGSANGGSPATAVGGGSSGGQGSGGTATGGQGSGGSAGMPSTSGVSVSVTPKIGTVLVTATQNMTATVTGASDMSVTWSVTEASCGSVAADGTYSAPAEVPNPAQCHIVATSVEDTSATDAATLTISAGSTGEPGVWEDVTPAGVTLEQSAFGGNNYGFMDAIVDPVRPSDVYVFSCYQGVFRSTDFGMSFVKSSEDGSDLENGRQWAAAVDPDLNRDPSSAPSLYTTNGYGAPDGLFKSTDWGVSWDRVSELGGIYSIDIDPYDNQHILVGYHENVGIAESTDGGVNWKQIGTSDSGNSIYPFFIDTGDAGTTRTTWIAIPQDSSGGTSHRTTNSGTNWTALGGAGHGHGSCQPFQDGTGMMYATLAPAGVSRSTDFGESWTQVSNWDDSAIVATPTTLYASIGPNFTDFPPKVQSAPRDPGTSWTPMTAPAGMHHGAKRLAVTNDGSHYIVIGGQWMSGIWRYVEP